MIAQNMGCYEMIMIQWFNAMLPLRLFMDDARITCLCARHSGHADGWHPPQPALTRWFRPFAVLYLLPLSSVRYLYNALFLF